MVKRNGPAAGRTLIISEGILAILGSAPTFLRRSSIRLLSARTGSEVLSLAGTSDPGLLLLEYEMPEYRGDQVCRRIRADHRLRSVPVVILGPREPSRIEMACRRSGCSLFTSAPPDDARLLQRIAEYLGVPPRRGDRAPVVLSISYGTVTSQVLGRSLNLSLGGILVRTSTPLRTGFFVNLRFHPDDGERPVVATGRILRAAATDEGEYEIGIRFLALPQESVDRIQRLLRLPQESFESPGL